MLAGVWVVGEYGDVLIGGGTFEDEESMLEVKTEVDGLWNAWFDGS